MGDFNKHYLPFVLFLSTQSGIFLLGLFSDLFSMFWSCLPILVNVSCVKLPSRCSTLKCKTIKNLKLFDRRSRFRKLLSLNLLMTRNVKLLNQNFNKHYKYLKTLSYDNLLFVLPQSFSNLNIFSWKVCLFGIGQYRVNNDHLF
jgi:hypothetical protein